MQDPLLVLRDIHPPTAPPLWPPAPGWWLLLAWILVAIAVAWWLLARRHRRRRALERLFDAAVDAAQTPAAKIAAMSELLRRASRRRDPDADKLRGEDWLRFLDDGLPTPVFATDTGHLLHEGGFRRDVGEPEVDRLRPIVRARFLDWMGARR